MPNPFAIDFGTVAPLSFNLGKPAESTPATDERRPVVTRVDRTTCKRLQKAREAFDCEMPGPGEALELELTGFFDKCSLIQIFLERFGSRCLSMRTSTLSLSKKNVKALCGLLDSGKVQKLDVLVS